MKNVIICCALFVALVFVGCSSDEKKILNAPTPTPIALYKSLDSTMSDSANYVAMYQYYNEFSSIDIDTTIQVVRDMMQTEANNTIGGRRAGFGPMFHKLSKHHDALIMILDSRSKKDSTKN